MSENKPDSKHLDANEDGKVVVTAHPEITEREIYDDRRRIVLARKDGHTRLITSVTPADLALLDSNLEEHYESSFSTINAI